MILPVLRHRGGLALRNLGLLQPLSTSCACLSKDLPPIVDRADPAEPTIPKYVEKFEEPIQEKRSRLLYQSRKRGILENGLLLGTFASKYLDSLTEEQLTLYDRLINLPSNDWEIYYWATETKPTPNEFDNEIMRMLKEHAKNTEKEGRYHLPNL